VPAGAVTQHDRASAWRYLRADFLKVQVHHLGVCSGCNYRSPDTAARADRPEDIDGITAIVAHHQRPRTDRSLALPFHPASPDGTFGKCRPNIGVGALLADADFVLKPNFDWRAAGLLSKTSLNKELKFLRNTGLSGLLGNRPQDERQRLGASLKIGQHALFVAVFIVRRTRIDI
jgi:hypothetical protein